MNQSEKPDLSSLTINKDQRKSDKPRSKAWRWLSWLMILIVIVVGYFLLKEEVTPALQVETATVTMLSGTDATADLVASGYVVAARKAEVASKGTGRLVYLGYEEGDNVAKGEVIAQLDNDDIKANLEMYRAALLKAQADSLSSSRTYDRNRKLFKTGSITEDILEKSEAAFLYSLAAVAEARAAVTKAEVDVENTYIRAPFDGTVLTKNADVGEIVAPFASSATSKGSVVTLADMSSLEVEADVSESNIQKVKVGQRCEIILDAYPETRYPARVKKIVPTADRSRATVMTKVSFIEKDDRVLPEMSARINFFSEDNEQAKTQRASAMVVSNDAITSRDGRTIIFRIENGIANAVDVITGRKLGSQTEIKGGLNVGDRIILNPPGKLTSGQKVANSK